VIKNAFIDLIVNHKKLEPVRSSKRESYLDYDVIEKFFDLSHERFINHKLPLETLFEPPKAEAIEIINNTLQNISFEQLRVKNNPWIEITNKVNSELGDLKKITINECVEYFQMMENNKALFKNSCAVNENILEYLRDKRVAFVGPAPYLMGQGKGELIDSYDVVVRIQTEIENSNDYGSRIDIIQSCLNSNYGPPVLKYINGNEGANNPNFVICNDTVTRQLPNGCWLSPVDEYERLFREKNVELGHLKNNNNTWDRWALYWEIFPKKHLESFSAGHYVGHTANFNSGYGALNYLLRYPIKELAVFGIDFYNCATPQTNEQKYNPAYIAAYGDEGRHLGPSKWLHDQLSQMQHCKNVLFKDKRFKLDLEVANKLLSSDVTGRLEKYKGLPKFKQDTE